ncbi:unnamed protein product [Lampetra planeri]
MADLFTERTPIVGAAGEEVPLTEESKAKIIRLVFRVLVTVMVTVNTSLCFVRGAQYSNKYGVSYGVKYFLLGCSLIGFNALLNIMVSVLLEIHSRRVTQREHRHRHRADDERRRLKVRAPCQRRIQQLPVSVCRAQFALWRRGDIPRHGQKFLYCFGGVITLQSILADIAAMSNCL